MENGYKLTRNGSKLIIEVDLAHRSGPSKSGKTNIVASSGGFLPCPEEPSIKVSFNVTAPTK
jgi:hypothetical protein